MDQQTNTAHEVEPTDVETVDFTDPGIGHNSKKMEDVFVNYVSGMIKIAEDRKDCNRAAADLREMLKDHGIEKEAAADVLKAALKKKHEKDGYQESFDLCEGFMAENTNIQDAVIAHLTNGAE